MKNKMTTLATVLLIAVIILFTKFARAGVFVLAGSGVNIQANSTSNFTAIAQIGTFTLNPQSVYLTQNIITNGSQVFVYGRLTFDGTNFFTIPQNFVPPTTNAFTGQLWSVTNITFPVYGAISVSNGMTCAVSNFSAAIQQ